MSTKYGNQKVTIEGQTFDSRREAHEYIFLRAKEQAGAISNLRLQPKFTLVEGFEYFGERVRGITYKPDFAYTDEDGREVVVEVKGGKATQTEAYRIRAKLFKKQYPHIWLEVVE